MSSTLKYPQPCSQCLGNTNTVTCDDPGVEVERHLAAVLEDDGLHQVAVPLQPDLVSLAPLPGVHQTYSNHHINMQRRLLVVILTLYYKNL